jgi:hypothetical protein
MKKRLSGSAVKPGKPASTRKTLSARPRQRVQPTTSRRFTAASPLEVITILPPEVGEPPLSSTVDLKRVRFGYFEPDAQEASVVGSFNNWNPRATPMQRDARGDWSVEVQLPPGEYRYRFLVDGEWRDDPAARFTAMNSYGSFDAVVVV